MPFDEMNNAEICHRIQWNEIVLFFGIPNMSLLTLNNSQIITRDFRVTRHIARYHQR